VREFYSMKWENHQARLSGYQAVKAKSTGQGQLQPQKPVMRRLEARLPTRILFARRVPEDTYLSTFIQTLLP